MPGTPFTGSLKALPEYCWEDVHFTHSCQMSRSRRKAGQRLLFCSCTKNDRLWGTPPLPLFETVLCVTWCLITRLIINVSVLDKLHGFWQICDDCYYNH